MGDRLYRVDFVGVIDLAEPGSAVTSPTPGHVPARRTPEGYLECDALLARDGLLTYSDGENAWLEYRPRAELEAALASFANVPVTDDHPPKMVDAESWSKVARGVALGQPTIEVHDAIAYMRARLSIRDAALIAKIESGDQVEVSIGFTSEVVPTSGAYQGIKCDAVQTVLVGNHDAIVQRGRAGPACRVMLDSAAWCRYNTEETPMGDKTANKPAHKTDATGPAAEMVEYTLPDGTIVQLPTIIVAMLQELQALKSGAGDAPAQQVQQPQAPAAAVVAQPALPIAAAKDAKDEEKEKEGEDSLRSIRRKLDRKASAAGVADDVLDSDDDLAVARAYVKKVMPHAKCDSFDAKQLRALVDVAFETPVPAAPKSSSKRGDSRGPWGETPAAPETRGKTDAEDKPDAVTEFLARQGYT